MKRIQTKFLAIILAALVGAGLLSSCVYDDGYAYYGDGYAPAPSVSYTSAPVYADRGYYSRSYAPTYRSRVYESPRYYRSPSRYYAPSVYSGVGYGSSRYYNRRNYEYRENNNRYRRSSTFRRNSESSKRPAEQRNEFKIKARDRGSLGNSAEKSLERDRSREKGAERRR